MKSSVLLLILSFSQTGFACPYFFTPVSGGRCFNYVNGDYKRFLNALSLCYDLDANLPSIKSTEENEAVRRLMLSYNSDYLWLGLVYNGTAYHWLDGTPLTYTNYAGIVRPNLAWQMHRDGTWQSTDEVDTGTTMCILPNNNDPICGDYDFVDDKHNCMILYEDKRISWNKAESICRADHGHLASIHNEKANDYVLARAAHYQITHGIHIGLRTDVLANQMNWTDNSRVDFTNFEKGFPFDKFGHCTALDPSGTQKGQWVSNHCNTSEQNFACSRLAFNTSNPMAAAGCPDSPFIYNPSGTNNIYSPLYPGAPGKMQCDYLLKAGDNQKVAVTFDDVQLNTCCDKLELFDGAVGEAKITLSGQVDPGYSFTSSGSVMKLTLTTTDGLTVRGFRARFYGI